MSSLIPWIPEWPEWKTMEMREALDQIDRFYFRGPHQRDNFDLAVAMEHRRWARPCWQPKCQHIVITVDFVADGIFAHCDCCGDALFSRSWKDKFQAVPK